MGKRAKKLPAMPFFVGDWFKAADLSFLPLLARGAWGIILFRMWEARPRGRLSATVEEWCRSLGATPEEFETVVRELRRHKVCDIYIKRDMSRLEGVTKRDRRDMSQSGHDLVTLINRRMFEDYEHEVSEREKARIRKQRSRSRVQENDLSRLGHGGGSAELSASASISLLEPCDQGSSSPPPPSSGGGGAEASKGKTSGRGAEAPQARPPADMTSERDEIIRETRSLLEEIEERCDTESRVKLHKVLHQHKSAEPSLVWFAAKRLRDEIMRTRVREPAAYLYSILQAPETWTEAQLAVHQRRKADKLGFFKAILGREGNA